MLFDEPGTPVNLRHRNLTHLETVAIHRLKMVRPTPYTSDTVQGYLTYKKMHFPRTLGMGPYRRPMPRVLGGSYGGWRFIIDEVPL